MYCQNCGKEVNENAYVCLSCGALLKSALKSDKSAAALECGEWTLNKNRALWTGFSSMVVCMVIFMLIIIDRDLSASAAVFLTLPALVLGCTSIGLGVTDYNKQRYGAATLVYSISIFSLSIISFIAPWTIAFLG